MSAGDALLGPIKGIMTMAKVQMTVIVLLDDGPIQQTLDLEMDLNMALSTQLIMMGVSLADSLVEEFPELNKRPFVR